MGFVGLFYQLCIFHNVNTLNACCSISLAGVAETAGIQLRKVEERRQKSEQKHQQQATGNNSSGRLDVQAIMEAAFEIRRKALEENDSDDDDDDVDGQWSDNE
jgi:hypothetical protein